MGAGTQPCSIQILTNSVGACFPYGNPTLNGASVQCASLRKITQVHKIAKLISKGNFVGDFVGILEFSGFVVVVVKLCTWDFAVSGVDGGTTRSINPCFLAGRKKKENKANVSVLKDTTGIYFPFSSCACPLIFFIPPAELRQPQIKAVRTVWHMMIKSTLAALEMDR